MITTDDTSRGKKTITYKKYANSETMGGKQWRNTNLWRRKIHEMDISYECKFIKQIHVECLLYV